MTDPSKGFKKVFDDAAGRREMRCSICLSTAHSKEYHENATKQQAVVTLSAVVKLVDQFGLKANEWDDKNEDAILPGAQQASGYTYGYNAGVCEGIRYAARQLEAALATAPSEQAASAPVSYPRPCGLCPGQIESEADLNWHGIGNCVPICHQAASGGALSSEPWLFAIAEPSGAWHDGEQCVFGDRESAQNEVDMLNDGLPEGEEQYKLIPLFRTLAAHDQKVREAVLEEAARLCEAAKVRPDGSCAGHTILDCHSSDAYWIRACKSESSASPAEEKK